MQDRRVTTVGCVGQMVSVATTHLCPGSVRAAAEGVETNKAAVVNVTLFKTKWQAEFGLWVTDCQSCPRVFF